MSNASTLFDLLAAAPRRRTLFLLLEEETVRIPDDVRTRSTAQGRQFTQSKGETEQAAAVPTHEDPSVLEVALVHKHLPKLTMEGVVEWDRQEGLVTRGPSFDEVEPALETLAAHPEKFPESLL